MRRCKKKKGNLSKRRTTRQNGLIISDKKKWRETAHGLAQGDERGCSKFGAFETGRDSPKTRAAQGKKAKKETPTTTRGGGDCRRNQNGAVAEGEKRTGQSVKTNETGETIEGGQNKRRARRDKPSGQLMKRSVGKKS